LLPPVPAFTLASADITDGQPLATRHVHTSAGGDNHSPALTWQGAPEGTRGFAITCYDPDAPTGSGFWHWLLLGLPATCTELAYDAGDGDGDRLPHGALHLRNDFGTHAYAGAAPPPGDPAHRYLFAVHALDTDHLGLDPHASTGYAGFTITAHTLARAVLRPTYRQDHPQIDP
jgi:Raf kinase inhibitor-like YbhB/YbcL family protein